ncbi:hypothetical protein DLM86_20285 [Paenibacillus flagellatus]|uniref:Uncharacterized protein n=2 Tax=Paenibacillus flagellatus TaxID=2211139 RepID=A0A2V5KNA2_9BACL|nr:hypothetical protein DLM86_20285 [Paenibacillus flagellatus]
MVSFFGVSYLQRQNPFMVAWWSAAFPGFGHMVLNQYFRGILLTLSEVVINTLARINEGMVYSFCGQFELAKSTIAPRWTFGYVIIYLFAIWDSYRSAVVQNKLIALAEAENVRINRFALHPVEVQYLEPKSPFAASVSSFFFPGLGQLYNHRLCLAFYGMFWWWVYMGLSRSHESLIALLQGRLADSIAMLHPHWLLFMPSVMGGAVYHAYSTASEHNRLFRIEQRQHFAERYRHSDVRIFP